MKQCNILMLLAFSGWLQAQDTVSLFDCYERAVENAPRIKDREAIRETGDLRSELAGAGWLPALDFNGKVSYQSDVVTIALSDPSIPVQFPEVPKDQYGFNLDLTQTLYDGGIARQKKMVESATTEAALQQVEVDLYGVKGRVNQYFFSILVLQEQRKNLEIHRDNLLQRREVMEVAIEEGAMLEEELKVMDVEVLKIRQSLAEVDSRKRAFLEALDLLCGGGISATTVLEMPDLEGKFEQEGTRPEYRLFDLKEASMEASKELIGRKRMPVLFAYGQTGYGKPGYNMLSGVWDFYYMVGAGVRWRIWDWNSSSMERQVIEQQQQMLCHQRDAFTQEMETFKSQERANMEQFRQSMEYEKEVLELQQEISRSASARLENGTITATDLVTELSKENLARIRLESHRIQLLQSMANYLIYQGTL
jgi:outer membrane protein TolC